MAGPLLLLVGLGWLMRAARDLGADPASNLLVGAGSVVLAAILAGDLANRAGLSKLVGYLVIGVAATRSCAGW